MLHAEGAGLDYGRRSTGRLQEATAAINPRWLVAGALEVVRRLLHLLKASLALDICPNEAGNHEHAEDYESPLQQAVGHRRTGYFPRAPVESGPVRQSHRAPAPCRTGDSNVLPILGGSPRRVRASPAPFPCVGAIAGCRTCDTTRAAGSQPTPDEPMTESPQRAAVDSSKRDDEARR